MYFFLHLLFVLLFVLCFWWDLFVLGFFGLVIFVGVCFVLLVFSQPVSRILPMQLFPIQMPEGSRTSVQGCKDPPRASQAV